MHGRCGGERTWALLGCGRPGAFTQSGGARGCGGGEGRGEGPAIPDACASQDASLRLTRQAQDEAPAREAAHSQAPRLREKAPSMDAKLPGPEKRN